MAYQVENGDFQLDWSGNFARIVEALRAADATRSDYDDLAQLLTNAQQLGLAPEAIADAIETQIPHLAGVGQLLRAATSNRAGVAYALVAMILAFLAYFYPRAAPETDAPTTPAVVVVQQPSEEEAKRWIREALEDQRRTEERQQPAPRSDKHRPKAPTHPSGVKVKWDQVNHELEQLKPPGQR